MYSTTEIDFDDTVLRLRIRSRLPALPRILFAGGNVAVTLFFILLLLSTTGPGGFGVFIGLCFVGGLLWLVWAWNAYGQERIVMTRKSVIRQKHYGLYETKPDVFVFDGLDLLLTFQEQRIRKGVSFGTAVWNARNPDTDLFESFLQTAIPISAADFAALKQRVNILLRPQLEEFLQRSQN